MTLNLIKLAVGIRDLEHLAEVQPKWYTTYHGQTVFPIWTRLKPTRDAELVGGSVYRVVKNKIQLRQRIVGIELIEDEQDGKYCLIFVDPEIIQTVATPQRPFQGWRYFESAKAPADRGIFVPGQSDEVPEDMQDDLKDMGLL
jgi:hypothetical protein